METTKRGRRFERRLAERKERAAMEEKFDNAVFISGFFVNALLAVLLVFIGDRLGIDLYYVASLAFGLRIFQNLAIIRRYFLKK